jgi:hypothetical protein
MRRSRKTKPHPLDESIFEIEVRIFNDPVYLKRARLIPKLSRTIAIRGRDSLEDLHDAIYAAFDRWDEHMWEFQIGGENPFDKNGRRYVLPIVLDEPDWVEPAPTADAAKTSIASLGLNEGDYLFYWFDFGDDWWHRLDIRSIRPKAKGEHRFPYVLRSVGESPAQYPEDDVEM